MAALPSLQHLVTPEYEAALATYPEDLPQEFYLEPYAKSPFTSREDMAAWRDRFSSLPQKQQEAWHDWNRRVLAASQRK